MRTAIVFLALFGCLGITHGDEKKADTSTKVTGTIAFPKAHPSVTKLLLQIQLYEYDPLLADASATLIDTVKVKDFTHEAGKETVKKFEIGAKGSLKEKRQYYLTVFLLDGDQRVSMGVLDHVKGGLGKVLTDGNPRDVKVTAKSVK